MKLGFIGLGRMGRNMVRKLLSEGHEVLVWNRSEPTISNFKFQISNPQLDQKKLQVAKNIQDLVNHLEKPRVVWSMVTVGAATENILEQLIAIATDCNMVDDIVIDGGNSFYKDTERRYQKFKNKRIRFLGIGVSAGILGPKLGYPMMAGGDKSAYDYIAPLLNSLAKPKGDHEYFGEGGAGHFVKMVHNGIEYGIMQSLGEGFDLLKNAPYPFDLLKVAKLYQKGTLVSGFMLDRAAEALQSGIVDEITGEIDATGEAQWTVETAKELGIPVEIIERSLEYRKRSKKDKVIQKSYTAKMVAALRAAFGAHAVKRR